jgi:hypothetical protein
MLCAGNPTDGYDVLKALHGAVSGWEYAYEGRDARCNVNNYTVKVKLESFASVGKNDEQAMKSYVGSTGPLSVCVDANDWGGYDGGVKTTCGTQTDHCVQIVGYGTEKGTEFWKVRNSWGADWGEKGNIRLKMGSDLCNIARGPTRTSTTAVAPAPAPAPPHHPCNDHPSIAASQTRIPRHRLLVSKTRPSTACRHSWRSSEGDPCSTYELNSYCTPDRREGLGWNSCEWGPITDYADAKGNSAYDACCACGGGTAPAPPAPPAPSPPSTCADHPKNWRSSEGDSCCMYQWNSYCTPDGKEGPSWDHAAWGPISDYADPQGNSALDACCVCGGGKRLAE